MSIFRASSPGRRSADPARSRPRSPGCNANWTRRASAWIAPRPRWRSGEKHARSRRTSPRARMPRPSARSADGCLRRPHRAGSSHPAGIGLDRYLAGECQSPAAVLGATHAARDGAGQPAVLHRTREGADGADQRRVRRLHPATDLRRVAGPRDLPVRGLHDVSGAAGEHPGQRASQAGQAPGPGGPRAGRLRTGAGLLLGHHQAARPRPGVYYDAWPRR